MQRIIKLAIAIIFILSLGLPVFARNFSGGLETIINFPPQPTLTYPLTEQVDLTGKDYLEFKWSQNEYLWTHYFDFRLYKGYDMYTKGLISKQRLSSKEYSFKVKSELFEDGQVYTWSLRRILNGGEKSERSFNSFKVIKK
jgi:hypothetical protein